MVQRTLLIVLLALLVPAASQAGPKDDVAAATAAWVAAYDSRDPARIVALYAPDAVFWGTSAVKPAATPQAVLEYFKDAGARPNARVTLGIQHIRVYGDIAINTGDYTFTDMRNGQPVTTPARFSMTFRLQNGQWKIVDHHSSRVPAATP